MFEDRLENYRKIEELRKSKLLVYITGDRPGAETSIAPDVLNLFADQLDSIGDVPKISLFIYSNGGQILAAYSLVNLIRSFCKDFEVIVPFRCQSAATLLSLGTDRIIMTKQATLGPIDPSTNGPMNPIMDIGGRRTNIPISVEHINGFLNMAREELGIKSEENLKEIFLKLAETVHPIALGNVYKARTQIKMLAEKLLKFHKITGDTSKIIDFLCSESGSHDYAIYRKEAKEQLGLNIEKPTEELYGLIKDIYKDLEAEMELRQPLITPVINKTQPTNYCLRRGLIESIAGGTDVFVSEGIYTKNANDNIQDLRTFEGWRHEKH